jgi:hypothetical protein
MPHPFAGALRCSPVALARIGIGLFLLQIVASTTADTDLWGHLRFGLDMLGSGTLHGADPYSFTSDRAWINHEWLAELLMAGAYTGLGVAGLTLLKLACIGIVAAIVLLVARAEQATATARDIFLALVVFATLTRTLTVRPQIFSVALFALLLYLVRQVDRGQHRALWAIPVVFAVWVNLHGGWLVGLGVLAIWLLGATFQAAGGHRRFVLLGAGAASVLATLLNPYGVGLWTFVAATVRLARPEINDWKPLLHLPREVLALETVLPTIAILCMARTSFRVPARYVAMLAVLVAATFRVGRIDAFAQTAIAILLAPQIVGGLKALEERVSCWRPGYWRASFAVGLVAIGLAGWGVGAAAREVGTIAIKGPWVPDPAGVVFLRDRHPGARVLTWFDWGEYALWHLSPTGTRVSMDGRRETVYSERVVADHFAFYRGEPDALDYPDRISADLVWLPRAFASVGALRARGWVPVFESSRSVVLARHATPASRATASPSPAGFPGP